VLLLDGQELVGAKQNRIINTTILLAPRSDTVIPVSCVEQGRWAYRTSHFASGERVMAPSMRAGKAAYMNRTVRETCSYRADQSAIWNAIEEKAERMQARSATMAMSDIYDQKRDAIQKYRQHFSAVPQQSGALFFINGRIAGMDSFGKPDTFAKTFPTLLDSYALDAIDWFRPGPQECEHGKKASEFIRDMLETTAYCSQSVALGSDIRFETNTIVGCALEYEKSIIHLSAFIKADTDAYHSKQTRMQRFSKRHTAQ
jgi:hypothetical protein